MPSPSVFAARRNATREYERARVFVYNEKLLWTGCEFRKRLLVVSGSSVLPFISFELNFEVRRTYRSRPMQKRETLRRAVIRSNSQTAKPASVGFPHGSQTGEAGE
jgi:hypothetical protein